MSTPVKYGGLPARTLQRWLLLTLLVGALSVSLLFTWSYAVRVNRELAAARDYTRLHDLMRLRLSLILHYAEHGLYPADLLALVPEYLSVLPRDPLDGRRHRRGDCPAGNVHEFAYRYTVTPDGQSFVLEACLETTEEPMLRVVPYRD